MGNDVTWWKDRDQWMPGIGNDPPPQAEDEEHRVVDVDSGEIADDDSDATEDVKAPGAENDQ